MRILTILAIILVVPILALIGFGYYYGAFDDIPIEEKMMGPYTLVYQSNKGPYTDAGIVLFDIYEDLRKNYEITTTKGFGIYYDDPKKVAQDKLRSDLGIVLEPKDFAAIERLQKKYQIKKWEQKTAIVATFPYLGNASPILGAFRVYPVLAQYLNKHQLTMESVMELYDVPEGFIYYIINK